jgi:hypothetical protein
MTSGIKFTGKKSKSPITTRAFKKRNGGSETSPSQFAKKTKTFMKVTRSSDKQRMPQHANPFHIEMPANLDPETIAGICVKVVHVQHSLLSDDELVAFLQFRDYLTLVATAAAASRTTKEIKQRFRSGSGSQIVGLLLADRAPASDGPDRGVNPHSPASDKATIPKGQTKQIETPNL